MLMLFLGLLGKSPENLAFSTDDCGPGSVSRLLERAVESEAKVENT
jgi:hypothetical protein